MNTIRIGLAGLGSRGLYALKLLRQIEGFKVVAMCDGVTATHAAAREQLGGDASSVPFYADYAEFLKHREMDAVMLCVRAREQGAMAAMALEAGKHVNSEVPATHSMEDCWRIVLAAERSGRVYQLAEQLRYGGVVEAWRDMVARGELGTITLAEGQYFHYIDFKQFRDPATGTFYGLSDLAAHSNLQRQWFDDMPPIHYIVHDLSPLLKVMDDRVTEVTAMSTASPSAAHPQLNQPDMQVALMRTAKGAILRLAVSFSQPHPHRETHWLQVIGTKGAVEWKRSAHDKPKLWLAGEPDKRDMDWTWERPLDSSEARASGHGGLDYHTHANFRDAILGVRPLEFDVYKAMDVAAPGVLAAESLAHGSVPMSVPDFRPNGGRAKGAAPK